MSGWWRWARWSLGLILWAIVAAAIAQGSGKARDGALIAAAADLRFALDEIAAAFARETGEKLRIVYGSSGNFRQQIAAGAPFELFLSADESLVFALASEGHLVDPGARYARGRLALVLPPGSPLRPDPQLGDIKASLADGRLRKFAMANPEHAPYGRAAQQALAAAGAWASIQPRLVLGENVAQAAQFALSGSTQGGLVALSLARVPEVIRGGSYVTVPEAMHLPLEQRMALTRRAGESARSFYRYLQSPAAREVLVRYGFTLPAP